MAPETAPNGTGGTWKWHLWRHQGPLAALLCGSSHLLWVMHHLDHADNLLKEMGVPAK